MASITKQRIGNNTYLYESVSYRDEQGRPRNKKVSIGKIDKDTGAEIFKQTYLDKMIEAGTAAPISSTREKCSQSFTEKIQSALTTIQDYGTFYFLNGLANETGLIKIMKEVFPNYWEELLTISYFLIANNKPLMDCQDWINNCEALPVGNMSSQRISELLACFGEKERVNFYKMWSDLISSEEYSALDITSLSSYSTLRTECEWGHNRDNESLRQINLCMLFGEKSGLPVYQTEYSGSLNDVKTLKTTIAKITAINGNKPVIMVMDKGFYSKKNINFLLEEQREVTFLVAVPFSSKFTIEQISIAKHTIESFKNVIITSEEPIRGVRQTIKWEGNKNIYVHLLYNPAKATKGRNDLYKHLKFLEKNIGYDKVTNGMKVDIDKYFDNNNNIKESVVETELYHCGWLILIGNSEISIQEAHDIYCKKDVVEKSFDKYKNSLGLNRLHIQSDERANNKIFLAFLSLILVSRIHKVMKEKNIYKRMTMDNIFTLISRIKSVKINGQRITTPPTKEMSLLFRDFQMEIPV